MIDGIKAFALSTIAAAVLATIGMALVCVIDGADGCTIDFDAPSAQALLTWVGFFAVFAAGSLAAVGLPLTLILSRFGAERAWPYLVFGFLSGCAIALGFSETPLRAVDWTILALVAGLPGALAGEVWWITYRRAASRSKHA